MDFSWTRRRVHLHRERSSGFDHQLLEDDGSDLGWLSGQREQVVDPLAEILVSAAQLG